MHEKPLKDEARAHFIALCERKSALGSDAVSPAAFYDALNELWESMTWEERMAFTRAVTRRRRGAPAA
jgi:hypothetical protein